MNATVKVLKIKEKYPDEIIETRRNAHNRMYIMRIRDTEYTTSASDQAKARADLNILYNSLMFRQPESEMVDMLPCCQECADFWCGKCHGLEGPINKWILCTEYKPLC